MLNNKKIQNGLFLAGAALLVGLAFMIMRADFNNTKEMCKNYLNGEYKLIEGCVVKR